MHIVFILATFIKQDYPKNQPPAGVQSKAFQFQITTNTEVHHKEYSELRSHCLRTALFHFQFAGFEKRGVKVVSLLFA